MSKLTTLTPTVVALGMNGREAARFPRPLRIAPTGGFAVMHKGSTRPVTVLDATTVVLDLLGSTKWTKDECRAAKGTDIGKPAKAPVAAAAHATAAAVANPEPAKAPRSIKQAEATMRLCAANLARAQAKGDPVGIAKAEKGVLTAAASLKAAQARVAGPREQAMAAEDAAKAATAANERIAALAPQTPMAQALSPIALAQGAAVAGMDLGALIAALQALQAK